VTLPDADPVLFRRLMSRLAAGVTIVTARDPAGHPIGMTATSFASVSLSPPLVSVCVDQHADTHRSLRAGGTFVVNLLATGQEALSRRFADLPSTDRFIGISHRLSPSGVPILDGVLAHLECEYFAAHELGDHTLFVGRVTGGTAEDGRPLLYYSGRYFALAE
jgi:flavin reductase (DIM6/NTAB) family NADH-FMN oxidoreductase RutF